MGGATSMIYHRVDGTTFTAPLFHRQMEYASLLDPQDGKVKVFKTFYDKHGTPLMRVEISQ